MSTSRTTISLPGRLHEMAKQRADNLHFATLSDYVQHLIREDVIRNEAAAQGSSVDALREDSVPFGKQKKKLAG